MHTFVDLEPNKHNLEYKKYVEKNLNDILTNEYKNNASIISKWATRAWLADSDYISLGLCVRTTKNEDNDKE